nr:ATP-dependent DNA helicase RRM3-like [Tanacetum cinerariifolium]
MESETEIWTRKKQGKSLGRIHHVPPSWGELYYLRAILNKDDKEYIDGILEAGFWGMGDYFRSIFVMLIMTDSMSRPEIVWEKTWMKLTEDVLNVERIKQGIPDLELSDIQRKNICLSYIECMLRSNNRSLKDIQNMIYPDQEYTMDGYNRLIYDETSYDKDQLREQHVKLYESLTTEQKGIYSTVMDFVDNNKGGMFFVYGYGGTGKTFLYKTMLAALRSKGDIVLNVASNGIATLLFEGGRTTHSRLAIPINVAKDSMCHIAADSDLADLIRKANLIIWDEAPMINMHCYEAFNRTLRDI